MADNDSVASMDVQRHSVDTGRSRAPEFYGFVAWLSTYIAFCLYVLWAIVPDQYIVWVGIEWYPSREWAILLPAWSVVLIITTYIVYSSMAIAATPSFSEMRAITDSYVHFPSRGEDSPYFSSAQSPELYDIPIGVVNRVLYSTDE